MKKLLISMLSAAALFSMARADEAVVQTTTWGEATKSGKIDFESYPADVENVTAAGDDGSSNGNKFWQPLAEGDAAQVVATSELPDAASEGLGSKALKINSDERVVRKLDLDGKAVEIDKGIFFDSRVQFTATESAPTPQAGDKLIVWLYSSESGDGEEAGEFGEGTKLMVTAGNATGDYNSDLFDAVTPTHYAIGNISIEPNTWHRLTIKTFCDDTVYGNAAEELNATRFVVLIDGVEAQKADGNTSFASLLPTGERLGETCLVDHINSVAFQGLGYVDEMEFTNEDPFPAAIPDFDVIIDCARADDAEDWYFVNGDGEIKQIVNRDDGAGYTFQLPGDSSDVTLNVFLSEDYKFADDTGWENIGEQEQGSGIYVWKKTFAFGDLTPGQNGSYKLASEIVNVKVELTVVLPEGFESGEWSYDSEAGTINRDPFFVTPGETMTFTLTNADGKTKTIMRQIEEAGTIEFTDKELAFTWDDYLGDPTDGAYTIDNEADLFDFMKGVNNAKLATVGETFKLTANIAMTQPWPGIGVYLQQEKSVSFNGTFDGGNFEISNLQFANVSTYPDKNKYRGLFNQLWDGAVRNLTVSTVGFEKAATTSSDKHGAAAIAGHAFNSTIENCTAKGTITGTHNVGGIVVRANRTLVKDCTNEANLASSYTKLGGVVAFTQDSVGTAKDLVNYDAGRTVIEGCVNSGTLTVLSGSDNGRDGVAGILGWNGDYGNCTIRDCSNEGAIVFGDGVVYDAKTDKPKTAQFVGDMNGTPVIEGENTGKADALAVWPEGGIGGLNYATVDGTVATYVYNNGLAAGGTYLVTARGAAPAVVLAEGDEISFNLTLVGEDFNAAGIVAESEDFEVVPSAEGNVITYTAQAKAVEPTIGFDTSDVEEGAEDKNQAAADAANSETGIKLVGEVTEADVAITDGEGADEGKKVITVGGASVKIPNYYTPSFVAASGAEPAKIALALNANAAAQISEAEIGGEPKAAIEMVDGSFKVTLVGGKGALHYGLFSSDTPNGTFTYVQGSQDTGLAAFQLSAPVVDGDTKKFYKVVVRDTPICGGDTIVHE